MTGAGPKQEDVGSKVFINFTFKIRIPRSKQCGGAPIGQDHVHQFYHIKLFIRGATKAQWIRLCLPSLGPPGPGFESQAHHLCLFHL